MVKARHTIAGLVLTLLASASAAGGADALHSTAAPAPVVSGGSLLQVGASLMLVLAAVAALAWLLKRFGPHQANQGAALQVISATAVGARERVVIVEVDKTWLVVGVAPGHITSLHTMPRPDAPSLAVATKTDAAGFSGRLKQILERNRHA